MSRGKSSPQAASRESGGMRGCERREGSKGRDVGRTLERDGLQVTTKFSRALIDIKSLSLSVASS